MKLFLEQLRALRGVAQILRGITPRIHLQRHRAALKCSMQIRNPLPVRMVQRFRYAQNGRQPPRDALIRVVQRCVARMVPRRHGLAIVVAH